MAKERMQKLRKDLSIDKERVKEMCNADLVSRKAPQRLSRTLPDSSGRYIKYFMYILHFFIFYTLSDKLSKYLFVLSSIFTLLCVYRQ